MYTLDILILSHFDSIVNSNKNFLFAFLDLYDINRRFEGERQQPLKQKAKKLCLTESNFVMSDLKHEQEYFKSFRAFQVLFRIVMLAKPLFAISSNPFQVIYQLGLLAKWRK